MNYTNPALTGSRNGILSLNPANPLPYQKTPHRQDLIISDLVCLNLSFLLGGIVAYGSGAFEMSWYIYLGTFLVVNVTWALTAVFKSAYAWYERRLLNDEVFNVFAILLVHFAVLTVLYYNTGVVPVKRSFLLLSYLFAFTTVLGGRILNRKTPGDFIKPFNYVVVGGKPENLKSLTRGFEYAFRGKARLLGRFGDTPHPNVPTLGNYHDLRTFLASTQLVRKVVIIHSKLSPEEELEIVRICQVRFIDLEVLPRETAMLARGFKMQRHGDTSILTATEEPLTRLYNKAMKRAFDIAISTFVVFFLLPFIVPVIAILIKLESKGPVFFWQDRSGYMNQRFKMLKFRTMTVNAASDSKQATRGDARVTKIGAFLRRTSIDELPQFWNVLMGNMSVVGPRPHMLSHTTEYSELISHYLIRQKIKPGITGWAQIHGYRGPTHDIELMRQRVHHDVWYLDNWSIVMDVRCVYQTVVNAVQGEDNAL